MKTNKCLYLTFQPIAKADGVSKKVFAQKDALNKLDISTSIIYPKINDRYELSFFYNDNIFIENLKRSTLISPYIYKKSLYDKIYNLILENNITFLYIRYGLNSNPSFLDFLKKCKKRGIVIFIEIATYPYDGELNTLRLLPAKCLEKYYRNKLYKYVNRIITYSEDNSIYNIKTINISNAAPSNLPLKVIKNISKNELHLLLVANIAFWHGIDRIIEGLKLYYTNNPQRKVYLDIVGNVTHNLEAQKLRELVDTYKLNDYICFCGSKDGYELDALFDKANLAIGCLGCHRKNITKVKSLKNIEYAIRGIPFVYSEINEDFDNANYILKVPANDTPIDIYNLYDFMNREVYNPIDIRNSVKHLTWDHEMNKIYKEFMSINSLT